METEKQYVRIKKGVRPYGGRLALVIRMNEHEVVVQAPGKGDRSTSEAWIQFVTNDPRVYRRSEVDLIDKSKRTVKP